MTTTQQKDQLHEIIFNLGLALAPYMGNVFQSHEIEMQSHYDVDRLGKETRLVDKFTIRLIKDGRALRAIELDEVLRSGSANDGLWETHGIRVIYTTIRPMLLGNVCVMTTYRGLDELVTFLLGGSMHGAELPGAHHEHEGQSITT